MKTVALTREVHTTLKDRGYKYLLITDVNRDSPGIDYLLTVKPDKEIPASQTYSCTGIDDVIITRFISTCPTQCSVYVELPELN
jgi:hypothetical protein